MVIPLFDFFSLFQNRCKRLKGSNDYSSLAWEYKSDFEPLRAQVELESISTRWVKLDGSPGQETVFSVDLFKEILNCPYPPLLENFGFPDQASFLAGGIHRRFDVWRTVLAQHRGKDLILRWLRDGVDIMDFTKHFKGNFGHSAYDCEFPRPRIFRNLQNCRGFVSSISSSLMERIRMGAVKVWGKVGETEPPFLVLPLTVEPSKPRLCLDTRFLNLRMKDSPLSLDRLTDINSFV